MRTMIKEEIHEKYWKQLVLLKKQYTGHDLDQHPVYLGLKKQLERERDDLLIQNGYHKRL